METHLTRFKLARHSGHRGLGNLLLLLAIASLDVIATTHAHGQSLQLLAPQNGFVPAGSAFTVLIDPFSDSANPAVLVATASLRDASAKAIYRLTPDPAFPSFVYHEVLSGVFNDLRRLGYVPNDGTPNGTLYALGQAPANRFNAWKTAKSLDGGASWTDDDTFYLGKGNTSLAQGLTSDAAGTAYSCGFAYGSAGNDRHWIVRRKLPGSGSWTTVSDLNNKTPGNNAQAMCSFPGSAVATAATVFVVGCVNNKWMVMRSRNQGSTWQQAGGATWPTGYTYAQASDIACDTAGNIYVAGSYLQGTGYSAGCVVQVSTNGGDTWTTLLDDSSTMPTGLWRLAIDNRGNVALSGKVSDSTGNNSRWVVIRPANPRDRAAWQASYLSPLEPFPDSDSWGGVAAADGAGNFFLGGSVANWNGYTGAALLRLIP